MAEDAPAIAIVGLACRVPGARDPAAFWQNLRDGVESISFFSIEDAVRAGTPREVAADPHFVRAAGILDDVDLFEADLFGYSPRDAELTDPQQRLFLELAWECLEDAGWPAGRYEGPIGVFAGVGSSRYRLNIPRNPQLDYELSMGNDPDHAATRAAYKLNLRGPAVSVQTACSSSLTAVCFACQSLAIQQCDMALAGGSRVFVPQRSGYLYQPGGIMSRDGHCRTFAEDATGTVGGSGAAVVLLKRLEDAVSDGDPIRAVIRGWAVNNDGASRSGYTAPSIDGQAAVVAMAQSLGGVEPSSIGYVETHGTATPLGDPIEVAALRQAFAGVAAGSCALGSVKTNIGHLDAAAGIAGLLKVVLALEHGEIPASLHYRRPNPAIDFTDGPFRVADRLQPWTGDGPRRAGVSSFGMGGTNAHVVLEQAPACEPIVSRRTHHILCLSDSTPEGASRMADRWSRALAGPGGNAAAAACTTQLGRTVFGHRIAVVGSTAADLAAALAAHRTSVVTPGQTSAGRVVFLFPGQGSQYPGMARQLHAAEPVFRHHVEHCAALFQRSAGLVDLRALLLEADPGDEEAARRLQQTDIAQPALFTVAYALGRLLAAWGVEPAAMFGHSVGECVAATLAEVLTVEDAVALVSARGRLMARARPGVMTAVALSEAAVRDRADEGVDIAAVNGPARTVLAGPLKAVERVERDLAAAGVAYSRLRTSHAFHSAMMDEIVEDFVAEVRGLSLRSPRRRYVGSHTGDWVSAGDVGSAEYWGRQLRQPVRYWQAMRTLAEPAIFVEVGPGRALTQLAAEHDPAVAVIETMPAASRVADGEKALAQAVGRMWASGASIDWRAYRDGDTRRRITAPAHQCRGRRYWMGPWEGAPDPAVAPPRIYLPSWQKSDLQPLPSVRSSCLALVREDAIGAKFVTALRAGGHHVTEVRPGDRFAQRAPQSFVINPQSPEDYDLVLQSAGGVDTVVHVWSAGPGGSESYDAAQRLGLHSVLHLTQALGRRAGGPVRMGLVGTGLLNPLDTGTVDPAKASLNAAALVITQENPRVACRIVDIDLMQPDWPELVMAELGQGETYAVAHRGGTRWLQRFDASEMTDRAAGAPVVVRGGTYLIAGGLGRIGLAIAEALASQEQVRLILTAIEPVPDRADWTAVASSDHRRAPAIARALAIEASGSEVVVCQADVADATQMAAVFAIARDRTGRIDGVVHAAGNTDPSTWRSIDDTDADLCRLHARARVGGALVLESLLRDGEATFVVLISALSTTLGGARMFAYAASNSALDALARRARAGRTRWTSMNWDTWDYSPPDNAPGRLAGAEIPLPVAMARATFIRVLAQAPAQAAIVRGDLHARLEHWRPHDSGAMRAAVTVETTTRTTPYVAPVTDTEAAVARIWEELLRLSPVGRTDDFFELGGHSLLAIQLTARLRTEFGADVSVQTVFDAPTVEAMAASLSDRGSPPDDGGLEALLGLVEQLPESEAERLASSAPFEHAGPERPRA